MTAIRRSGHGKIFEQLSQEGRLSRPLLKEIKREFDGHDWFDPGAIGRLYERELATSKAKQRASGSFYTPDYLVDFVVKMTIGPVLEELNLEQVYLLRVLDPSCGGGAFLLGVLRCLEARCLQLGALPGPQLRRRLCSACLVGVDLDPAAIEVTRAALHMAIGTTSSDPLPLSLVVGDALLPETEVGRIDAIVGNPPWGQKGLRLSAKAKKRYKQLYRCAQGTWDPFKLFVERCHQLLPEAGRWGLVLPDIILLKDLQRVRDLILDGSALEHIAHCGRAFEGANIDAVAICGQRLSQPVHDGHSLQVWPKLDEQWQQGPNEMHRQKQSVFSELPGHKFNLYLHGKPLALYRRLRVLPRLGSVLEMHEGVHTGNSRAKLFIDDKIDTQCKPVVLGRNELAPYQLNWAGRWLNTDPTLLDRSAGEYANLGKPRWHLQEKIVVRRTGDRVLAAMDLEGLYVSNNMFVLFPCEARSSAQFQQALVALLNSRFMTWYFRAIQPRVGRLFAELKLLHLRDFPLPSAEHWAEIEPRLAELERQGREHGIEGVAQQVDLLVEKAFEISPQEREVIRLLQ